MIPDVLREGLGDEGDGRRLKRRPGAILEGKGSYLRMSAAHTPAAQALMLSPLRSGTSDAGQG